MKKNSALKSTLPLIIGEAVVVCLVIAIFLLADLIFKSEFWNFGYNIVVGALLGAIVTVFNYLFLIISVNRAVDRFLLLRGTREMSDEEAEKFAKENSMQIQNAIKISFILRTVTMLVTFVIAFILGDIFNPLATVIPLLMYRPILYVSELIKAKRYARAAAPFILTDFDDISDTHENTALDNTSNDASSDADFSDNGITTDVDLSIAEQKAKKESDE